MRLRGSGFVLLLLLLLAWRAGFAAASAPPDFASQVSAEEAVVVSITTVSLESPFILDPDEGPVREGAADRLWSLPLAAAFTLRPRRGLASGFIVSADGHVLTSAHAVMAKRDMTVRLADGREFVGRVVGIDVVSDVALLKIDADDLAAARIGDPQRLAVGDWVTAIGAPFGLETSVTAGIVSARRLLPGAGGVAFIQTDVAINPGSSGGPLFNLAGEVVGMNSMVYTSSGGYMGVSFALPVDAAMSISRQLRAHGRVVRGQLGLGIQEVTHGLARAFGLPRPTGALVSRVQPRSAAERAGCRVGDIVLGFDGRTAMSYAEIQRAVAEKSPGTAITLALWRGGAIRHVGLAVASAPPEPALTVASERPGAPQGDRLGLVVAEAPSGRRAPPGDAGPEVRESYGAALRAGLGAGDQIVGVNHTFVRDVADYETALSRLPRSAPVALLVMRDGRTRYFALDPGADPTR